MRKNEVDIPGTYSVKVGDRVVPVQLTHKANMGGWYGTNLFTGRTVRVKTAARLRNRLSPERVHELKERHRDRCR